MPKFSRKKIGDSHYEVLADGIPVGEVVLTGRYGADHYPWSWGMYTKAGHGEGGGSADTMKAALDNIQYIYLNT